MSNWAQGPGSQPPPGNGPNTWWSQPSQENTNWQQPGHNRMFGSDRDEAGDPVNRSFTTRKKHGWWGKEERYDMQGRKIEEW